MALHQPGDKPLSKPMMVRSQWVNVWKYSIFLWQYVDIILLLTHWGRVTHICVGKLIIIGSDNGLSPDRRQAIIWTNAGILLIRPLGTNFSEILIKIPQFSSTKMHLKISSAKWRPFCPGGVEFKHTGSHHSWEYHSPRPWHRHPGRLYNGQIRQFPTEESTTWQRLLSYVKGPWQTFSTRRRDGEGFSVWGSGLTDFCTQMLYTQI